MDEIKNGLNIAGERLKILMIKELKNYSSLYNSNIVNDPKSITWEINKKGLNNYELIFKLPSYAVWIDQGRGSNKKMPPSKDGRGNYPIREWMKRKNIPLEAEYAIRKTIGVRGIKPRPFLDKSLNKFLPDINKILKEKNIKIINEDLQKIINKIN